MKTMPRILLLLFSLSGLTMLFITKCGLQIESVAETDGLPHLQQKLRTRELFSAVIEETEKKYQARVEDLEAKIQSLKSSLMEEKWLNQNLSKRLQAQDARKEAVTNVSFHKTNTSSMVEYLKNSMLSAEILHGVHMKSEYEVFPFNRFTINRIFMVDPGLGKRVVEKPIGFKKKDLLEVIIYGISVLNKGRNDSSLQRYTTLDFIEGIYRNEPTTGTQYELYFRNLDNKATGKYSKVIIMRPFGPLMSVSAGAKETGQRWINVILPLKGRLDSFQSFMNHFIENCILKDKHVFLTVVYFGQEGLQEVSNLITSNAKKYNYNYMKLIALNEKFSRGRGLQAGVLGWKGGDVVLFMCDVDIIFTVDFLERCRLNTEPGKRVYYPIVFSLYNPHVVYSLHDQVIPSEKDQLVISKHTGFWRDFGYGMTCQYRSDFLNLGGFDENIMGWGGEDVSLYKKYVRGDHIVIRATDPGIFHIFHGKVCDPSLSSDQYQSCIRSKALNEASHAQLGLLAFKDEVNIHKGFKRRTGERVASYLSKA